MVLGLEPWFHPLYFTNNSNCISRCGPTLDYKAPKMATHQLGPARGGMIKPKPIVYPFMIALRSHNITQRCGPSKYKNGILGAQSKYESPCTTFWASHYYILRVVDTMDHEFVLRPRKNCDWLLNSSRDYLVYTKKTNIRQKTFSKAYNIHWLGLMGFAVGETKEVW